MKSFLIRDCTLVNEGEQFRGSVLVRKGSIERIYRHPAPEIRPDASEVIEAKGLYLFPGIIDDQVHFREPGLTHKGDIYTESRAGIAGGVTSFMEMPNTIPQTTTLALLEEKFSLAEEKSLANYSFYLGATNDNLKEITRTDPGKVCGVKVFLGASTGDMLVGNPRSLAGIFEQSPLLVAIHSEDEQIIKKNLAYYKAEFGDDIPVHYHPLIRNAEACYVSTARALELATRYNTRLHVLHLSTARELALLDTSPASPSKRITSEVCIHHLWFDRNDYLEKGSLIKWNPAIKDPEDREALFGGLFNNRLDIIATDHAPHTLEEKDNVYTMSPSGGPLLQHSFPAMLEFARRGLISLEKIADLMCHKPAEIFGVRNRGFIREDYRADLVLVNLNNPWKVGKDNILYKCGWSPFEGTVFHAQVSHTFVNGNLVYENGRFYEDHKGERLEFNR